MSDEARPAKDEYDWGPGVKRDRRFGGRRQMPPHVRAVYKSLQDATHSKKSEIILPIELVESAIECIANGWKPYNETPAPIAVQQSTSIEDVMTDADRRRLDNAQRSDKD